MDWIISEFMNWKISTKKGPNRSLKICACGNIMKPHLMKSLNWRKISRFYVWIILLVLAVIVFILLRSPVAGQRQASQGPSELSVSAISEAGQNSNQSVTTGESSEPSTVTTTAPANDGTHKPLPEAISDPFKLPSVPLCPLYDGGIPYSWRCQPCKLFPYEPFSEVEIVCLDSEDTSVQI